MMQQPEKMMQPGDAIRISRLDTRSYTLYPEGYRMKRPTKGWWRGKLAAWCWRMLHRLNAVEQFAYTEKVYRYTKDHQEDITKRFISGMNQILRRGDDPEDYCFVLGAEDFAEMMDSEPIRQMLMFSMQEIRYQNGSGYRASYHGIPVHVVPGVGGMAAIPKVIVEKHVSPEQGSREAIIPGGVIPDVTAFRMPDENAFRMKASTDDGDK